MPAYVIALVDVTDPDGYKQYVAGVPPTIAAYGGRFVARAPGPELLEGGPAPGRAVVLEFPTMDAARAWHASKEYEPLKELRQQNSTGTLLLVPGYGP